MAFLRTSRDKPRMSVASRLVSSNRSALRMPPTSQCSTCIFRWSNFPTNRNRCRAGVEQSNPGYDFRWELPVQPAADGNCPSYVDARVEKTNAPSNYFLVEFDGEGVVTSVTNLSEVKGTYDVWILDSRRNAVPEVGATVDMTKSGPSRRVKWRETVNRFTDKLGRTRHATIKHFDDVWGLL